MWVAWAFHWTHFTTINWAAIDLARLLDSCGRRDRVLLEAQLAGVTAQEFARRHGATQTAIRSRFRGIISWSATIPAGHRIGAST